MNTCHIKTAASVVVVLLLAGASQVQACRSHLECQLNGVCDLPSAACRCDPAWKGPNCSALNLLPTSATGDLRIPDVSTWGMTWV